MSAAQEILAYVEQAAPEGTAHLQSRYLNKSVDELNCTLELDRPNVDIKAPDGSLVARLNVPTGELVTNL